MFIKTRMMIFLPMLVLSLTAQASATRSLDADQIQNPAHTITQTMPSSSGTLLNTASHVPTGANQVQEVPSGTVNGSNVTFTVSNTPPSNSSVSLYQDGLILIQGTDYTISSATITMTTAPVAGQKLYAVYNKY